MSDMKLPHEQFLNSLRHTVEVKATLESIGVSPNFSHLVGAFVMYLKMSPEKPRKQGAPKLYGQRKPETRMKRAAAWLALVSENCFYALQEQKVTQAELIRRVIYKYQFGENHFSATYLKNILRGGQTIENDALFLVQVYVEQHPDLRSEHSCLVTSCAAKSILNYLRYQAEEKI